MGHCIFISTPRYTVASPPTISVTSSSVVICSYFWATSDTMTAASCALQTLGLHTLLFNGLSLPQSESCRLTMCPWAIFCTHSTALVLTPPLHFLLHCNRHGTQTCVYMDTWLSLIKRGSGWAALLKFRAGTSNLKYNYLVLFFSVCTLSIKNRRLLHCIGGAMGRVEYDLMSTCEKAKKKQVCWMK